MVHSEWKIFGSTLLSALVLGSTLLSRAPGAGSKSASSVLTHVCVDFVSSLFVATRLSFVRTMDFDAFLAQQEACHGRAAPQPRPAPGPAEPSSRKLTQAEADAIPKPERGSWSETELGCLNAVQELAEKAAKTVSHVPRGFLAFKEPVDNQLEAYELWASFQRRSMATCRAFLGDQCRDYNFASFCTGAAPEKVTPAVQGIRGKHIFSAEILNSCNQFMRCNTFSFPSQHMFACIRELASSMTSMCVEHGERCKLDLGKLPRIDCIVIGASCRPFSYARTGRGAGGCFDHPDASILVCCIQLIMTIMPRCVIFENVTGFLKNDKQTGEPPLTSFLRFCDEFEVWKHFVPKLMIMCGSTYLVQTRRRFYMTLTHKDSGGQASADIAERIITVAQLSAAQTPALKASACLVPVSCQQPVHSYQA